MFVSICCICNTITKIQEPDSPGLLYSHGYCQPCYAEEIKKLDLMDLKREDGRDYGART